MDKTTIDNALLDMGMPIKLKGFNYISDAVMLLDKPEWKNPKWTALYHCIATLNNDTACSVEKSIRSALASVRKTGNIDLVSYYIGFDNCSNSNSIYLLYTRLKSNENEKSSDLLGNIIKTLMSLQCN